MEMFNSDGSTFKTETCEGREGNQDMTKLKEKEVQVDRRYKQEDGKCAMHSAMSFLFFVSVNCCVATFDGKF